MSKADDAKSLIQHRLDKALANEELLARKNVERLRRVHPSDTPQALIRRLDRDYLASVTLCGGASGGAGRIMPNAGILATLTGITDFTEASLLYTLSLAEVHGIHPEDFEQRKRLVRTVLFGAGAVVVLDKAAVRVVPYWTRRIIDAIPMSAIDRVNDVLSPRFVTKYGTKQGVLVLSKQMPRGLGAAFSAGGNHLVGRLIIKSARSSLGQPPSSWAEDDHGREAPFCPGSGDPTP